MDMWVMHKVDRGEKWPDHSSELVLILNTQSVLSSTDIDSVLGPGGQIIFVNNYAIFSFSFYQINKSVLCFSKLCWNAYPVHVFLIVREAQSQN